MSNNYTGNGGSYGAPEREPMRRLLFYWAAEATVGVIVTWLFAHVGDVATFTALAGTGLSMAVTSVVLAPVQLFGTVLLFLGNLAFPFVGATVYEESQGQPISAVVKGEDRTGTTWERTGGQVVKNITRNPSPTDPDPTPDTGPPTTPDTPTTPNGDPTTPTEPPSLPPTAPPETGVPPQTGGPDTGPPAPGSAP
ncbi:hypothetical protein [Streptomyces sclerotialus]|uniref:hypothetical protein n=1 Tax=Streptomyces sclerotialus TaxID=1957 RepID=UPI0004C7328C